MSQPLKLDQCHEYHRHALINSSKMDRPAGCAYPINHHEAGVPSVRSCLLRNGIMSFAADGVVSHTVN